MVLKKRPLRECEKLTHDAGHTPETGINPLRALVHLSNAITTMDHVLRNAEAIPDMSLKRRVVYARNTLREALYLWQDDALERLARSRGGFYVYSMTDSEKLAFIRRMRPALSFTAEEMRNINHPAINHLVPLVEELAEGAATYATENRQSLIMAKNSLGSTEFFDAIDLPVMPIPAEKDTWTVDTPASAAG